MYKKKNTLVFLNIFLSLSILSLFYSCSQKQSKSLNDWSFTPFIKQDKFNPVLEPLDNTEFLCPVRGSKVRWEEKDVFNPAAVVKDGKIYLLYRAEDIVGKLAGTSRIGIAVSEDGLTFIRHTKPILYPQNDEMKEFEWEGGCEDPRIVEDENGTFYMTYTAWNGDKAMLLIATSTDLFYWTKHGSVFKKAYGGKYTRIWSKSGSIVCRLEDDRLIATKINGKYWMYFGDSNIYLAHSDDLINWIPVEYENIVLRENSHDHSGDKPDLMPVLKPRKDKFDSDLVEPGPPALITKNGILFIYNSRNSKNYGDKTLPPGTYAAGQVLFDPDDPGKVLKRLDNYFFKPDKPYEITGQINNVCFIEGLVHFKGKWFLYYGTADSKIAVATYYPIR